MYIQVKNYVTTYLQQRAFMGLAPELDYIIKLFAF